MPDVSIIVPTYNEAPNIAELVSRIERAMHDPFEIIFVDDSTDDTAHQIEHAALSARMPVRLIRRTHPHGGLAGAVTEGLAAATSKWCVVMDGDLQHPPEAIPVLLQRAADTRADVVVGSRHVPGGSSTGLSGPLRRAISEASTVVTRAMFPTRLRDCADPMSGFFAVRREAVDLSLLKPRGFKILLEILVRNRLTVAEAPFTFGERHAGQSKASLREGFWFLWQLALLRFGRLSGFAVIGALGAVANLVIMAALQAINVWYVSAAIIAAVLTIIGNFVLLERFVFHDLRTEGRLLTRFAQSFTYNGLETLVRTGALWAIVALTAVPSILTQAVLLGIGFVLRFVYHSRVVYRPEPGLTPQRTSAVTSGSIPTARNSSVR
ncbi:MAG: glycosyltransferase family 2 protein [Salinibacterium sp.]|nr:MAG: glycosyltransferase family 2 protein [Salinibacterium sp.]